jgi:hypothetical protein
VLVSQVLCNSCAIVCNWMMDLEVPRSQRVRESTDRSTASMSDMTIIREDDLIETITDALQYISYYHPMDYIQALGEAYKVEQGPAAKDAIAQILTNSRMCAEGHRPICQDTGIVNVFMSSMKA